MSCISTGSTSTPSASSCFAICHIPEESSGQKSPNASGAWYASYEKSWSHADG